MKLFYFMCLLLCFGFAFKDDVVDAKNQVPFVLDQRVKGFPSIIKLEKLRKPLNDDWTEEHFDKLLEQCEYFLHKTHENFLLYKGSFTNGHWCHKSVVVYRYFKSVTKQGNVK